MICVCSRPHAPPHCHTAVLINEAQAASCYTLPPNTHLTLKEEQEPPWIATFLRWQRYEDKNGFIFVDQRDTLCDDARNYRFPTIYLQVNAGGRRTRYRIVSCGNPRFVQIVNAINYSPDVTFDRTGGEAGQEEEEEEAKG